MRRSLRSTPTRIAAPALALALVLTACADGDDDELENADDIVVVDEDDDVVEVEEADGLAIVEGDEESAEVVAAAVDASAAVTSARTRFTSTVTTPQGESVVEGEGVGDGDSILVEMVLGGPTAEAYGQDTVEIEVRLLGDTMYQRFPALLAQLDLEAEWISFDLADLGPEFGQILDQARATSPGEALSALREAGAVAEIGEEDLDGIATTHYAATLDLRAVLEGSGLDGALVDNAGLDLDQAVPVDVWVDGEGLVRRYDATIEVDGVTTTTSFEVLEYDVDVDVEAPPAEDTVSFREAMAQQG